MTAATTKLMITRKKDPRASWYYDDILKKSHSNISMLSRILEVKTIYEKYSEILPEELDDAVENNLKTGKNEMEKIFKEDMITIDNLNKKSVAPDRIKLQEFKSSDAFIIRRGFLDKNEKLIDKQKTKFDIAHLFMCKSTLSYLSQEILNAVEGVRWYHTKYNSSTGRDKRIAFIDLTRIYQNLIGFAVNILDLIAEYAQNFRVVCKKLDNEYIDDGPISTTSRISHYELVEGVKELLLRGNFGRFTPSPLIRSVVEIIIKEVIFNPKNSNKYKHKKIRIENSFILNDILGAADALNIRFQFGTECIRKLYSWGSISTHYPFRMNHHEMWYALRFAEHLARQGLIICKREELEQKVDAILDHLMNEKEKKITLIQ